MLPPKGFPGFDMPPGTALDKQQRKLIRCYTDLSEQDRHALLRYAEFLQNNATDSPTAEEKQATAEIPDPRPEEAPEGESVIAGIKRLSRVYYMIDKADLLHETSSVMTQHVMQGKPAKEAISELDALFQRHYQLLKDGLSEDN